MEESSLTWPRRVRPVRHIMPTLLVPRHENIYKPYRCRYNHHGDALEKDVRAALDQVLSDIPHRLHMKKEVHDGSGHKFRIDVLVTDLRSKKRYAIIECKNITSTNPVTNQAELLKAMVPLLFFAKDNALKICVVNRRRKLSEAAKKKIDHIYNKIIKAEIYDWSADPDWLRMAYRVRKAVLRHRMRKEDGRMSAKLEYYVRKHLNLPEGKRETLLRDLGIEDRWGRTHDARKRYHLNWIKGTSPSAKRAKIHRAYKTS